MKKGWVSPKDNEIPSGPALTETVIHGWAEYALLRNLSSSSIAPLLLTHVLTLYHMIVNKLKLENPKNGDSFEIYVLGAESELDSLPLLEELAYIFFPRK